MKKLKSKRLWQGLFSFSMFIVLWYILSVTGLFGRIPPEYSKLLLPPPNVVFNTLIEYIASGVLIKHVSVSTLRVAIGFTIAVVIGVPLGLGMALIPMFNNFMEPFVRVIAPIPGIAWVPLAILWFGLGNNAAIFIITVGSIFPIVMNTIQGVRDVDYNLVDAARTMGANHWQVLRQVMLPGLIPYLVTGFRVGLGFAWRVIIAAEMVGVPDGLGYMLGVGRSTARTDVTILTIVCLGMIMLAVEELLFVPLDKRTRFWRKAAKI